MKHMLTLIFLAVSVAATAQQPKPAPVITEAQKLAYFKAQAEALAASQQAQSAAQVAQTKQQALQAAGEAIVAACGKEFSATMDATGNPACVAKPEAKK